MKRPSQKQVRLTEMILQKKKWSEERVREKGEKHIRVVMKEVDRLRQVDREASTSCGLRLGRADQRKSKRGREREVVRRLWVRSRRAKPRVREGGFGPQQGGGGEGERLATSGFEQRRGDGKILIRIAMNQLGQN
ncbi:hypothetical protein KFK09_003120 [Dendrobium nobile]|uniref:Uncharacterized protein n=1 Tax=Dendrobium nobile TaxID=94219 RepID=A0A8T3C986_DENNO|nr:hypothetical protein KFK09_003120 [Dendrobium nobile]